MACDENEKKGRPSPAAPVRASPHGPPAPAPAAAPPGRAALASSRTARRFSSSHVGDRGDTWHGGGGRRWLSPRLSARAGWRDAAAAPTPPPASKPSPLAAAMKLKATSVTRPASSTKEGRPVARPSWGVRGGGGWLRARGGRGGEPTPARPAPGTHLPPGRSRAEPLPSPPPPQAPPHPAHPPGQGGRRPSPTLRGKRTQSLAGVSGWLEVGKAAGGAGGGQGSAARAAARARPTPAGPLSPSLPRPLRPGGRPPARFAG